MNCTGYLADQESKTKDGYFVGFPAIWNVVCLYLFVLGPPPFVSLFIVAFFAALTFVPILAVHPFRVAEWRSFTWLVAALPPVRDRVPSPTLHHRLSIRQPGLATTPLPAWRRACMCSLRERKAIGQAGAARLRLTVALDLQREKSRWSRHRRN